MAASFVQLMFTSAFVFYGLAVYLRTLTKSRGFSVTAMSFATALFWVASGLAGLLVARLIARVDARFLVAVGAVGTALCIAALGHVTALWHVFVIYPLFGAFYTPTAVLVTNTLVTRWFHRRRSVALSVATTGLSVGGIVLTPIASHLLRTQSIGSAMNRIAVMQLVGVVVIPLLLLRPSPASMGFAPDGDEPDGDEVDTTGRSTNAGSAPGVPFADAIRTLTFVAITITFGVALLGQVGGISQIVKLASERADEATAGRIVSVLAGFSVAGRLLGGAIVQRSSTRRFAFVALVFQGSGLLLLSFANSRASILVAAAVFGLGVGNVLLLHPLLLGELFGVRDYARIYGRSQLAVSMSIAAGPLSMGWLRDHAGGYRTSYLVAFALSVFAIGLFFRLGRPTEQLLRSAELAVA